MNRPTRERAEVMALTARHLSRGKVELFEQFGIDLVLGAREGVYLHDTDGERRWINCHCNGGVFNLGHRNPELLEALRAALGELDIGNHHLVSPWRAELAHQLSATTGHYLEGVIFSVGGGEAIDLAIKAARAATGRQRIVSALGGYHGHTGLAMAAGDAEFRDPFGPNPPGFVQVPFNDLAALEAAVDDDTAGVLLEPIPATLGMPMPDPEYLSGVEDLCQSRGAKFILDEVQTGLGRTGRVWFFHHEGIQPDILVTGKALSGGLFPIAATLMTPEVHRVFDERPFVHISTFGGADLGCAVALKVLEIVQRPELQQRVAHLSERFGEGLAGLPATLRRCGLMMGLAFEQPRGGMLAAKMLFDRGVFAVWANNDTRVVQMLPPLTIDDEQAEVVIAAIRAALGA